MQKTFSPGFKIDTHAHTQQPTTFSRDFMRAGFSIVKKFRWEHHKRPLYW